MNKLDTYSAVAPVAAPAAPAATPDNTPIPGGGSWHWDATQRAWVANTPDPAPQAPQSPPSTEPTQE